MGGARVHLMELWLSGLLVLLLARASGASLSIDSGSVHASATANCGNVFVTTTPADVLLTLTGAANSASASASDPPSGYPSQSTYVQGGVSRTGSELDFTGFGSCTGGPPGTNSYGTVGGTVYFTIDVIQDYSATATPTPPYPYYFSYYGTLYDALNNTVATFGNQTVTLTPGQYHVTWSMGPFRNAGTGGSGSGALKLMPLPEPGMLGVASIAALWMARRRIPRHARVDHV
jgi:hypothetical protein